MGSRCISKFIGFILINIFLLTNFLFANTDAVAYIEPVIRDIDAVAPESDSIDDIQQVTNNTEDGNDFISGLLSNGQGLKLTADPNETIDLFSGSLHLDYKDVSVPVAPGLNMEYTRSYSSETYDKFPYYFNHHADYNSTQNGWQMHAGYISELQRCQATGNVCMPVYVQANGRRQVLLTDKDNPGQYRTMQQFVAKKTNSGYVLTAPNGFKYYFNHSWQVTGAIRYFLTRVETADGHHYVNYQYNEVILTKITSSDPNKVIDIKFQHLMSKVNGIHRYVAQPTGVYYNDQLMASYSYEFGRRTKHSDYVLMLTSAKLASGIYWQYGYTFVDLRIKRHEHSDLTDRLVVTSVTHTDGESTTYGYGIDPSLRYQGQLHATRLVNRQHNGNGKIANGNWDFQSLAGPTIDNNTTKLIRVKSPYNTGDYIFNSYQHGNLWKLGTPAEIKIYANHNTSGSNIIHHETYKWQDVLHNTQPYKANLIKTGDVFDAVTKRAVLKQKTITRGPDSYTSYYSDYDKYDNPRVIKQTGNNKSRIIKQDIVNLEDKNILGLKAKVTVDDKQVVQQDFDNNGNVVSVNKLGAKTSYKYNNGLLAEARDSHNNSIYYSNYNSGVAQTVNYPDGTSEHKSINRFGLVNSVTDPLGNQAKYSYDNIGRLISSQPAQGAAEQYSYNILNKSTTHGSYKTHENYNTYGLLFAKQENKKNIIFKYDALGRKVFQSYSSSGGTTNNGHYYTYDSLNRITSDCAPKQGINCITYGYTGNNTHSITYPNGETQVESKQAFGDPDSGSIIQVKQGDQVTGISRDNLGYVLSVKQGNITKTYNYDNNYNLIKYTEPETGVTEYKYDSLGNVLEKKNNKFTTKYNYHKQNYRLLNIDYSDDSYNEEFSYDKNGNLIKAKKGRVERQYKYNQNNQLTEEALSFKDLNTKNNVHMAAVYNYNNYGQLVSVKYPDNSVIDYQPNADGLPTKVGNYISQIQYFSNNHWSSMTLGNRTAVHAGMDDFNRINKLNYGPLNLHYNYDTNNNLKNLSITDASYKQFNHYLDFAYDKQGRITKANGPWGNIHYSYDYYSNIIIIENTKNKNDLVKLNYKNGRLDQMFDMNNPKFSLESFTYDSLGNIKQIKKNKYLYGLDSNLLTAYGKDYQTFDYDTEHHRVIKSSNNHESLVFYNKAGEALYEYNPETKQAVKYIYFNGQRIAKVADNNTYYYYNDALGSPISMADSKGTILWREVYQPFGKRLINQDNQSNKHWFVGKELDSNNLAYFGARYYSSDLARFMAPDPVAVDPTNPASFNKYMYANNNPYKYVDVDGREPNLLPVMAAEFILGAFIGGFSAYDGETYSSFFVGAATGGAAALLTSPASSRAAALAAARGFSVGAQSVAGVAGEMAVNTSATSLTSLINDGESKLGAALTSSFFGYIAGRKINYTGESSKTIAEVIAKGKYSTAISYTLMRIHKEYSEPKIYNMASNRVENANKFNSSYTQFGTWCSNMHADNNNGYYSFNFNIS